ncbi:MAG: glycerate kinase [Clostridia bacterium]|nr:glycerate kinase [Clostridia bacterium]
MMQNKTILVIPDSFKGALSAADTGEAIASGVRHALGERKRTNEVLVFPAADGGEGTAQAVAAAMHGQFRQIAAVDLFGHPMEGAYADLPGDVPTAVLDMAACCGIGFARQYGPDPMRASTYGVGMMLDGLVSLGYKRILVGLGGSGTNDGGIGALAALGAQFTAADGSLLDGSLVGQVLSRIDTVEISAVQERLAGVELVLLYDVAVPLTGESGATRMFGRQKGASPEQLDLLENGMLQYASAIGKAYGEHIPAADGAGAAGGLGCGLHLAGGRLCHGAGYVLETLGIPEQLRSAALVFTGEGRTDIQTARGKLPHTVARYAKAAGVPCVDICGQADPVDSLYADGMTAIVSLVNGCITVEESMERTAELAERAAYNLTRLWLAGQNFK